MTIFWKIAHSLYKVGVLTPLARMFEFVNYWICANAVSAKAEIGSGTKFWHRGLDAWFIIRRRLVKTARFFLM